MKRLLIKIALVINENPSWVTNAGLVGGSLDLNVTWQS